MCPYQCGNPSDDEYIVGLLHRAILHGDQPARVKVQQCLCGVVRGWLHRHPNREVLYGLESEENYVDVAFERFWRLTIDQRMAFNTLATALEYLRVSLNEAILDRLRATSRPKAASLLRPVFPGKLRQEDLISSAEVWECLQKELLNVREQRLAYLLFHCGFKPGEIVHCCSQEFSDVDEIYRLRCSIFERILRKVDCLQ